MILDIHVIKGDDGFTAEIPSIHGCELWAPTEDEVLDKIVELAKYYLKLEGTEKMKIDKARDNFTEKVYKLIFTKK